MLNFATAAILDVNEDGNCWKFTYRGTGNGARGLKSKTSAQALAQTRLVIPPDIATVLSRS